LFRIVYTAQESSNQRVNSPLHHQLISTRICYCITRASGVEYFSHSTDNTYVTSFQVRRNSLHKCKIPLFRNNFSQVHQRETEITNYIHMFFGDWKKGVR